jgi:hypothetical protein
MPNVHPVHAVIFQLCERKRAEGGSHDSHGVVVENCGNVFRGKLVRGVADEQTCLADSTVADDDTPVEGVILALVAPWKRKERAMGVLRT